MTKFFQILFLLLTLVFSSCGDKNTGTDKTEEAENAKECPENKLNTLMAKQQFLSDRFEIDISEFEIKDVKAFEGQGTWQNIETGKVTEIKTINVYLANYQIKYQYGGFVDSPAKEGERFIQLTFQGEPVPEGDTPKISDGVFEVLAKNPLTKKPAVDIIISKGRNVGESIFGKSMRGQVKAASAEIVKLTDKEVCGTFKLEIDGKMDVDLSFNAPIIKDKEQYPLPSG